VQAIAALDIRILNCDRNEGNILVKKLENDVWSLIPIDHALSLPDTLSICDYELCWSLWPQIEAPVNEKLASYIKGLDTRNNLRLLKKYLRIRPVAFPQLDLSSQLPHRRNLVSEGGRKRPHTCSGVQDHVQA
jgi:hypothetical protein